MAKGRGFETDYVPSRQIDFMFDENDVSDIAFASGFLPLYDAEPEVRKQYTDYAFSTKGTAKAYHSLATKNKGKQGDTIKAIGYRKYEDADRYGGKASVYSIPYGDMIYYYVDLLQDSSVDIYALGATLYAMLTGVKPDESTNRKINDEVVPPNQLNSLISDNLSNTVMKAIAIDRHMRFKNVAEFLSAVNGERKVVTLAQERKLRGRKRFLGITAAVVAVSICAGVVLNTYTKRKAAEDLKPATISVWYSVEDGSTEEDAMLLVQSDFEENFEDVTLELRAIPSNEYANVLYSAATSNSLPNLFESTDLSDGFLNNARSLSNVIASEQFAQSVFLQQYDNYYKDEKRMPLGIEVPMAYVITNGATCVDYTGQYFRDLSDFGEGVNISADSERSAMLKSNYGRSDFAPSDEFLNNQANTSPVLLSSTMLLNDVRTKLTNYEKSYAFYGADEIYCDFTYEWSIGQGSEEQVAASEKLLSWMLGNVYQSYLMISKCNDGQIPVNDMCFESKIQAKNLAPIADIYDSFIFNGRDD